MRFFDKLRPERRPTSFKTTTCTGGNSFPLSANMESINLTVKVPFAGDRSVNIRPDITVKDLIDMVMSTCQPDALREAPQCIVHSGRILSDTSTLSEAGISNDAVLHLMRRPRDGARVTTRDARRGRGRFSVFGPDGMDHEHEHGNEDEDDPHFDPDEHDHEHHVHTNVVIGHIAVDGRIRYNDAHDVLLSVLHAVGFSSRAVNEAAAVAAAVAVSAQAAEERGSASRSIIRVAWDAVRRGQQQMRQLRDVPRQEPQSPSGSPQRTPNDSQARSEPSQSGHVQSASACGRVAPSDHNRREIQCNGTSEAEASQSQADAEPESTSLTVTEAPGEDQGSPTREPDVETLDLLPENPPDVNPAESDMRASARATDRLLPVLANLLEDIVPRIRRAPSVVDIEGTDRLRQADTLVEQLGAVASAVTSVATILSTVLPDISRGGLSDSGSRSTPMSRFARAADSTLATSDFRSADHRMPPSGTGAAGPNGNSTASEGNPGATPNSEAPGVSERQNGSRNANENGMPANTSSQRQNGGYVHHNRSQRTRERPRRVRVSRSQASNADFIIRVLSYYFCSLSEAGVPEPSVVDGQTAASVLDGIYGRGSLSRPSNPLLRVFYVALQKLNPRQFHTVCRGNFLPLASIREDIWKAIEEQVGSPNPEETLDPADLEEQFIDSLCDVCHEFIHIIEAVDHDHGGVFAPRADDFCHEIMHSILGRIYEFKRIFTGRSTASEFASKLKRWVSSSSGHILLAVGEQLDMQWDRLIKSFRRACHEVAKSVVGEQYSVLFPFIANLFSSRAKAAYDAAENSARSGSDIDHSNCGPGCEGRQAMLRDVAAREDGSSDPTREGDSVDLHNLVEEDPTEDDEHDDEDYDGEDEDYIPSNHDEDSMPSDEDSMPSDDDDDFSFSEDEDEMHSGNGDSSDLNDDDLEDLAAELTTEVKETPRASGTVDSDNEFDQMARELQSEQEVVSSGKGQPSGQLPEPPKTTSLAAGPAKRIPVVSSASGASLGRPGVGPSLRQAGMFSSSAVKRPSFSSAAVPRAGSSLARSTVSLDDDFNKVLDVEDAQKWRNVVEMDEGRIRASRHGPLSRGYRGDRSAVPKFNSERGSVMASEAARSAAREAQLSASDASQLEEVARSGGSQYLEEVERAIAARLRTDSDYNPSRFPSATKRFARG